MGLKVHILSLVGILAVVMVLQMGVNWRITRSRGDVIRHSSEVMVGEMAGAAEAPPLSGARPLTVPLKVEVGAGPNWAEAH